MDLQSIVVFVGFIGISALVVFLVSVFGTREKTYEEAIAEQKRRAQEVSLNTKPEKPAKEKKKKFIRKPKDKPEKGAENEDEGLPLVNDNRMKIQVEVIESPDKTVAEKKSKHVSPAKKLPNREMGAKDSVSRESTESLSRSSSSPVPEVKAAEMNGEPRKMERIDGKAAKVGRAVVMAIVDDAKGKEEVKGKKAKLISKGEEPTKSKDTDVPLKKDEKEEVKKKEIKVVANIEEIPLKEEAPIKREDQPTMQSAQSPTKKPKKLKPELSGGDGFVNGTRMVTLLKNAILTDSEVQTLIEVLLNKQQDGESWTKPGQKMDPLSILKKQVLEKDQALVEQQQLSQSSSAKLKEVRQDLAQEKARSTQARDKMTALQTEIQNLQRHIQTTQEQQQKTQQAQTKMEEEHQLTVARMQAENDTLQQAYVQLESDSKSVNANELTRLQRDVEQWRSMSEQYQTQQMTIQRSHDEAEQMIVQLKQCIEELEASKVQQEQALQATLADMSTQRQQLEAERDAMQLEVCGLQNLQSENLAMQNQIVCLENSSTTYNRSMQDIEAKLQNSEDKITKIITEHKNRLQDKDKVITQLTDDSRESRSKLDQVSVELKDKDLLITKLNAEVRHYTDELNRLEEHTETLRKKNDDAASNELHKERDSIQSMLERIFPTIKISTDLEFQEWMERFEETAVASVSSVPSPSSPVDEDMAAKFASAEEAKSTLDAQVRHYKAVLADTERILKMLQSSVEEEEEKWQERFQVKTKELEQLKEDNRLLVGEKRTLESSLEQIRAAEEAAAEMQDKLKELQAKLQGEETERRSLEVKWDEAHKNVSDLRKQLDETQKELQDARKVQNTLDELKKEVELVKTQLEKSNKENAKLSSLVKIGEKSMQYELDRVAQLQKQLSEHKSSATNGSTCHQTEIPTEAAPTKK